MGFMDKVKETATKAGDAAKEVAKAGQEKVEETQIRSRIKGLKEELGGVVYAERTGGAIPGTDASFDAAVLRIVGAITEQEAALAAVGTTGTA